LGRGASEITSFVSYRRWEVNERSMRLGRPLGYSPLVRRLAVGIVVLAVISAVLVAIGATLR
jgi:uncharacterized membrane protein YidH (DUF202 family)